MSDSADTKRNLTVQALLNRVPRLGQVIQSLGAVGLIQLCLVASGIVTARGLGPSGRGDLAVILTLPAVVMQIVGVGFPSALTYFVARQPSAWDRIARRTVRSALLQTGLGLLVLVPLDFVFLAHRSTNTHIAALLVTASFPAMVCQYYTLHIVQGLGAIRWFNALRVSSTAGYSGGIVCAALLGLTIVNCALVWTSSQLLVGLIGVVDLERRRRTLRRTADEVDRPLTVPSSRTIARFAISGFLGQVSPIESFRLDTLIVAALFPARIVGFYSVANSITNVPLFTADALSAVAYPHVAAEDGVSALTVTRRYMKLAWLLCCGTAIVSILLIPFVLPLLFGSAYFPAVSTGELLACAAAALGLRRIGNDFLRAVGKPGVSTRLELITLGVFATALLFLGPVGAGRGVAGALIVAASCGLLAFARVLRAQRMAETSMLVAAQQTDRQPYGG